ncbi:MAG: copper resistance protein CopC/CopD [Thermomicrobiales bacterium]|nr:copper resistance protein CopC/CopD [Thermomicrobiales bacterium]
MVGLFALLFAGSVQAHAMLVSSSITDGAHFDAFPTELVLTFSEEVGLVEGGTTLHGSNFEPIELSPTATDEVVTILLPEQGDGAYAVQWRVISADGHPISGTVRFTVGADYLGESASVDQPLPDWFDFLSQMNTGLLYLGLLAASGVVITGWFVARDATADICRVARRSMTMGLLAACVQLPLVAIAQRGEFFDSLNELMSGILALDWSLMLLPVMLLAAIVLSRYPIVFLVPLLGALAMLLLTGHTRSGDPMWLMMLSDGVHISVGAIWLGGLIVLTLGLSGRWFRSAFATPNIPVARFSALAAWSVSALAITGGIMAWRILDSWDALFQTAYGQTLLIKVGVVLLVMVIAGVNRFWLLPRTSMAWLRKLVLAELVLLIVVTGVTGRLVNLDPNVQAATSEVLYQGQVDLGKGYLVELSVISDDGEITVTAQMSDDMGMVVTPVESPVVAWSLDAQSLGPLDLELESTANGDEGAIILPVEGSWSMDISVRVDRFTELHTSLQIQTNP